MPPTSKNIRSIGFPIATRIVPAVYRKAIGNDTTASKGINWDIAEKLEPNNIGNNGLAIFNNKQLNPPQIIDRIPSTSASRTFYCRLVSMFKDPRLAAK
jgi:hypothetical protein